MFSGLRQNGLFYILEKGEDLKLRIGQVVSVSNPQPKYTQFGAAGFAAQPEMTVDVKVKVDEEILEFKQLNANASIANSGSVIVSDSKEAMSAEVEGLLHTSKGILDSVSYHEKVLASCDGILRDLNPSFKKEKEQEEKIGMLEDKMIGIEGTLSNMMSMLSTALEQSKSRRSKED
jgi:ribosome-associated translation inhibitor RaiA